MFDFSAYFEAGSLGEALAALAADPEAVVIAGGTDVLIQMREGKLAGKRLLSIDAIEELRGVSLEADGTILIRPLTTFNGLSTSPVIQAHIPALGLAADQAGGPQLRHVGTVGGNICNGVTSADTAATLLSLNARLELVSLRGSHQVYQEHFYLGPGKVDRQSDELLIAIRIAEEDYAGYYGHYIKFAQRNAMDIATLGCAAQVKLSEDKGRIASLRLAYGVAGPTPLRCREAEALAAGQPVGAKLLDQIGRAALAETRPRTSWRASKEFRQQLIYELAKRAMAKAIQLGGGVLA